jgi:L-ascorbate metabolism protein UlaG (beta-lactamase superfamily)
MIVRNFGRIWDMVRESHANPLAGSPQHPPIVPSGNTAITFIGHSSFLIQTAGHAVLVDPVFATRLILLRRQRRPGLLIRDLPPIDTVLLTHAHMDHLNLPSLRAIVRAIRRRGFSAPVAIVPNGVDDLIRNLGFSKIHSLEWWQSVELSPPVSSPGAAALTVTATPARHWGARKFSDTHRGFGGYVLASGQSPALYHSGDTAYFNGFTEIGRRLHPAVALLPIGAYSPDSYRAAHTSPEEALQAFLDVGAHTMIPMHYNTFRLSYEPMDEPLARLLAAAQKAAIADRVVPLTEGESWFAPGSAVVETPAAPPRMHARPSLWNPASDPQTSE